MSLTWWADIDHPLWSFAAKRDRDARQRDAAILDALRVAGMRKPTVPLDEIRTLLAEIGYVEPIGNDDIRNALDELQVDGLVSPCKDYAAAINRFSDGRLRQEAWALTKRGRIVVRAVRDATRNLDRALQLPPRLLDALVNALRDLLTHFRTDADLLATDLAQLVSHGDQLQSAASDFYTAVAALVQEDVTRDAVFHASSERILAALQQFAQQTENSLEAVRAAIADVRETGHAAITERALRSAGIIDDKGRQSWRDEMHRHLDGLGAWVAPHGAIEQLVDSAAGAINTLLGAIDRRHYARSHGSDLASDFRLLARMIYAQPSEAEAHRIFAAAFGLWPARHPRRPAEEDLASTLTCTDGPVHETQVTLRSSESARTAPRLPKMIKDVSAAREAEEARLTAELAEIARLSADLITPGPVSIKHFEGLDEAHTGLLMDLVEEALDNFDSKRRCGLARNTQCELRLWPPEPVRVATVEFAEGTYRTPDLSIEITPLTWIDAAARDAA